MHGDRKDASLGVGLNKDHLYVCASVEEYGDAIAAQCQEEDVHDRTLGVNSVGIDIPAAKYQSVTYPYLSSIHSKLLTVCSNAPYLC